MNKKTYLTLLVTIISIFMLSFSGVPAYASALPGQIILPEIVMAAPWDPTMTFTFTNVYDTCLLRNGRCECVYLADNGTLTTNRDVTYEILWADEIVVLKANEVLSGYDFSEGLCFYHEAGDKDIDYIYVGKIYKEDEKYNFKDKNYFEYYGSIRDYAVSVVEPSDVQTQNTVSPVAAPPVNVSNIDTKIAKPTESTVLVNGAKIEFAAYNIENYNYFKLRDLAYVLNGTEKQFNVYWDNLNDAISLTSGYKYDFIGNELAPAQKNDAIAERTNSRVILNGKTVVFTAYNIGGFNYFRLRDIGEALDFGIDWNETENAIIIDTSKNYMNEPVASTGKSTPLPDASPNANEAFYIVGADSQKYFAGYPTVPYILDKYGIGPEKIKLYDKTDSYIVYSLDFRAENISDTDYDYRSDVIYDVLDEYGFVCPDFPWPSESDIWGQYGELEKNTSMTMSLMVKDNVMVIYETNSGGKKYIDLFIIAKM